MRVMSVLVHVHDASRASAPTGFEGHTVRHQYSSLLLNSPRDAPELKTAAASV